MLKVNNNDTRTTSLTSVSPRIIREHFGFLMISGGAEVNYVVLVFLVTVVNRFCTFSSVSIVDFEQLNVCFFASQWKLSFYLTRSRSSHSNFDIATRCTKTMIPFHIRILYLKKEIYGNF